MLCENENVYFASVSASDVLTPVQDMIKCDLFQLFCRRKNICEDDFAFCRESEVKDNYN